MKHHTLRRISIWLSLSLVIALSACDGGSPAVPFEVSITNPTDGAVLSEPVEIEANVSGNEGGAEVAFFVDNDRVSVDASPPYLYLFSTLEEVGSFNVNIRVTATASDGNTGSDEVNVTLSRPQPDIGLLSVGERSMDFKATFEIREDVFIDMIRATSSSGVVYDLTPQAEFNRLDVITLPEGNDLFPFSPRDRWTVTFFGETRSGFTASFENEIRFTKR